MHSLTRLLFFVMFSSFCPAAESSEPANFGSAEIERKPAIEKAMAPFIAAREVSGVVTLVADQNRIIHLSADGLADIENQKPMLTDSMFWIASMTKPVVGTAVMMLHEQGLLALGDPVSKYLPEFKNLKDASGNEVAITIQQCLTHTSGLSELHQDEDRSIKTLAELTPRVAAQPVKFPPGSKWVYSQSSINTAARIVEVVSKKPFTEFLQEQLFTPLGMDDTTFYPTPEQIERLAISYKRTADGVLEKAAIPLLGGGLTTTRDRYPRANCGLFSTAADFTRFAQMILRGGELGGRRFLKPESVQQMITVQSGELVTGFTPGNGWGSGWGITREPQGTSAALSPGSFGHGGAFGTQAWIDPVKQRIYLLLIQRADIGNSDDSAIRRAFQNAAIQP
jgi:CubicO group peptidase (beta-lactamase class C family)